MGGRYDLMLICGGRKAIYGAQSCTFFEVVFSRSDNMKKSLSALSLVLLSANVQAYDFTDTAKVVSSSPIHERISEPKRECTMESVQVMPKERSIVGAVVGSVAGGVLGSQVGGGTGS